jgi:hypothetical protein
MDSKRAQKLQDEAIVGNAPIYSYNYQRAIFNSRMDSLAKLLILFYCFAHSWESGNFSCYEEQRIAAHLGISVSTLHVKRKYLVKLGWISVQKRKNSSPFIAIFYGENDPLFEEKGCAKWKPENKILPQSVVSKMSRDEYIAYCERLDDRYRTSRSKAVLEEALRLPYE